jgi:hypothetical protein
MGYLWDKRTVPPLIILYFKHAESNDTLRNSDVREIKVIIFVKLIINFTLGNYSEVSFISFTYTLLLGSHYFSSSPTQQPKPLINLHVKNLFF